VQKKVKSTSVKKPIEKLKEKGNTLKKKPKISLDHLKV